jgi:hypothetical protein
MALLADKFMHCPAVYRRNVWFMHDGTTARFSYASINYHEISALGDEQEGSDQYPGQEVHQI